MAITQKQIDDILHASREANEGPTQLARRIESAAVAAERERCAKLCEREHAESGEHPEMALHCAERIRGLRA